MMTEEAIRNRILHFAELLWGSKNINRFDPAVRLMTEGMIQELTRVKDDLENMDFYLLEKLAIKLTPDCYTGIRPGYSLIHFFSNNANIVLNNRDVLGIPEADQKKNKNNITASFSPLFSLSVSDIKVRAQIFKDSYIILDAKGVPENKIKLRKAEHPSKIWIGLEINSLIKNLKNTSFYFDLPHLKTSNELFELFAYTKLSMNGKAVSVKEGFLRMEDYQGNKEVEIVSQIYHNQFLTIDKDVLVSELQAEVLPNEVLSQLNENDAKEIISGLEQLYWMCFTFLPNFRKEDLQKIVILNNVIPVLNKHIGHSRISADNLAHPIVIEGGLGERLLKIDKIEDSFGNQYKSDDSNNHFQEGTYHIESYYDNLLEDQSIKNKLTKLSELLVEQRAAFPNLDLFRIESIVNVVGRVENRDKDTTSSNNKMELEEIGRLSIIAHKKVAYADIYYWLTQGELANRIAKGTVLLPPKSSYLHGCNAYLMHKVEGAKEYTDVGDIQAIDKYIFTSRDKVISRQDIENFCYMEHRKELKDVKIYLTTKLSVKPKEGFVRLIQIDLYPNTNSHLLTTRGVLKDLKTRLSLRSPSDYNYQIKVVYD